MFFFSFFLQHGGEISPETRCDTEPDIFCEARTAWDSVTVELASWVNWMQGPFHSSLEKIKEEKKLEECIFFVVKFNKRNFLLNLGNVRKLLNFIKLKKKNIIFFKEKFTNFLKFIEKFCAYIFYFCHFSFQRKIFVAKKKNHQILLS